MCGKLHCAHSADDLCICAPVQSGDVLQIVFHLAENMEDINWELDYKSLADLNGCRLCLIGKCRKCGGRLCVSRETDGSLTAESLLDTAYQHLEHFHEYLSAPLSHTAFRKKFAAMFHLEDQPFVEDWLLRRKTKAGGETETRTAYTVVHTAAYADRGDFPAADAIATFFDETSAVEKLRELVEKEKNEMDFPYGEELYCEEYDVHFWEAYCKDYAAGWFTRYEVMESPVCKLKGEESNV